MIWLSYTSILMLVIFTVLATLLVVWLIYRNMIDKTEFEMDKDDVQSSTNGRHNEETETKVAKGVE